MKPGSLTAAFFAAVFSVNLAFAGADTVAAKESAAKVGEMKSVLFKLVRQDETLDGVIDGFNAARGKLSARELSEAGLTLKAVKGGLDDAFARNKRFFSEARPDPAFAVYARTILSYSGSISRKITKVGSLLAGAAAGNKKAAMRDAVSSRSGGKTKKGKNLSRLLEEQKAMEQLSSDLAALKASSRKLTAASKWLYIVSK